MGNLGKKICEYWQDIASKKNYVDPKIEITKIKDTYPKNEWETQIKKLKEEMKKIIPSPLDFLEGDNRTLYLIDMYFAQNYAELNRYMIMESILKLLEGSLLEVKFKVGETIETEHNYIDPIDNIIRKGAIKSYNGKKMIIPLNMRDGILICEGKSNREWNFSAPHGAGRVLSRSKAKDYLDLKKFENDMEGIYSTSVCRGTIDEAPDAYKDSKLIEEAIKPTATILDRIIPIHNMKDINSDTKPWLMKRRR
jgi:RNA-splicing ligase RtcB